MDNNGDKEVSEQYLRLKNIAEENFRNITFIGKTLGKRDFSLSGYKYKPFGKGILLELKDTFNINPEYIKNGTLPKFLNNQVPEFKGSKPASDYNVDFYIVTAYGGNGISLPDEPTAKISMIDAIQVKEPIYFQITTKDYEQYGLFQNQYLMSEKTKEIFPGQLMFYKRFGFAFINRVLKIDDFKVNLDNEKIYHLSEIEIIGVVRKSITNV